MWGWLLILIGGAGGAIWWFKFKGAQGGVAGAPCADADPPNKIVKIIVTLDSDGKPSVDRDPVCALRHQRIQWKVKDHGPKTDEIKDFAQKNPDPTKPSTPHWPLVGQPGSIKTGFGHDELEDKIDGQAPKGSYKYSIFVNGDNYDPELIIY